MTESTNDTHAVGDDLVYHSGGADRAATITAVNEDGTVNIEYDHPAGADFARATAENCEWGQGLYMVSVEGALMGTPSGPDETETSVALAAALGRNAALETAEAHARGQITHMRNEAAKLQEKLAGKDAEIVELRQLLEVARDDSTVTTLQAENEKLVALLKAAQEEAAQEEAEKPAEPTVVITATGDAGGTSTGADASVTPTDAKEPKPTKEPKPAAS